MLKKTFIFLVFWFGYQSSGQLNNYNTGDIVNNFTVTDTDGQTYTLYDLLNQGKYVYIDFFATNCGTCQTKISIFNAFYDKYGCNAGDVFCISIEVAGHNNADVEAFEQQYGGNTNHAPAVSADGGAAAVVTDFGISSFPIICGIDPQKKLFIENVTPVSNVNDIAQSFPRGFDPPVMTCSTAIEMNSQNAVQIFPNPAQDQLFIKTQNNKPLEVIIYTINGAEVFHKSYKNQQLIKLDLSLKTGLYFIKINDTKQLVYRKIFINN